MNVPGVKAADVDQIDLRFTTVGFFSQNAKIDSVITTAPTVILNDKWGRLSM